MGAITPIGASLEETWGALLRGESGGGPITRFDASEFSTRIAAEVKAFDPLTWIPAKDLKKMDTFIQLAVACTAMAMDQAKLTVDDALAPRAGVSIGAGLGGLPAIEYWHKVGLEKGFRRITPFFIPMLIPNLASGQASIRYNLKGPNYCVVTACATGNHSVGMAMRSIQYGEADVMIAGGTEYVVTPLAIGGFMVMKALSTRNDDPKGASRPFDAGRDGFVMGEGAGVLVLESLEHAEKRGATIYGEIVGFGQSGDAYHITTPDPSGDGAVRCMNNALADAGIEKEQMGYINAHGTSTPYNDATETEAIKTVFGDHAGRIAISSSKSMTGHLLGAAGAVEAIISIMALRERIAPPTINYTTPDPGCDLDYVPNVARAISAEYAMSNAFGFGGTNATVVFRRPD
jgi:3-oxoacyl-[acyl-carrier-protein] synthase II